MKKFVRGVKIVVAVVALTVMIVWSMVLYKDAVIEWWIVPAVTLGVGLATGLHMWRLWRGLTDSDARWWNYGCHVVFTAAGLTFAFFALNNMLADRSSEHIERGVVAGHFREERRKTRRVGRRYVATGEKYYVYKLKIELDNGEEKFVPMDERRYRRVHDGDSVTVPVMKGLLGVTVMETDSMKIKTSKRGRKRRR